MEIKILGTGCAKCKALEASTRKAVSELGIEATIIKETNITNILSYNVMRTPALVVDNKVVAQGKQLSSNDIKEIIS